MSVSGTLTEEEIVWFMFSYCKCAPEIKLNIEWQMTF